MASSPILSHRQSTYSAGPSRLRISHSYPNLGREASSSATPGPAQSSPTKKNSYHNRPSVLFTKFRSSSAVPDSFDDEFRREQKELVSRLKSNFEGIQSRFRDFDSEDDDEIDLSSETRYTPDGKVLPWRPDKRNSASNNYETRQSDNYDDDEDDEEDDEDDEDDVESDEDSDEDITDSGADEDSEESEDELCDWGEQEEAVRKRTAETLTLMARQVDPFWSDALDDEELDAQFLRDEAKRVARSRERSVAYQSDTEQREYEEDHEESFYDRPVTPPGGWGTRLASSARDLYDSDASEEDDFASYDASPRQTGLTEGSYEEDEPNEQQGEDVEPIDLHNRVANIIDAAREARHSLGSRMSRSVLSESPRPEADSTESPAVHHGQPLTSNGPLLKLSFWRHRLPTPSQQSPSTDKGKRRMMGERPTDSLSPNIVKTSTSNAPQETPVPMLLHTPSPTPVPAGRPSKKTKKGESRAKARRARLARYADAAKIDTDQLDPEYYYRSLYHKPNSEGLRSCCLCRRAGGEREKHAFHCRGRISTKACVFQFEKYLANTEPDTETTPQVVQNRKKRIEKQSTDQKATATTAVPFEKSSSSRKSSAQTPKTRTVEAPGPAQSANASSQITPTQSRAAALQYPDPAVDVTDLEPKRYYNSLIRQTGGDYRRCRVCACAKSDYLVRLAWWCRGRISYENCGNKDVNFEGYLAYRATSRYIRNSANKSTDKSTDPKPVAIQAQPQPQSQPQILDPSPSDKQSTNINRQRKSHGAVPSATTTAAASTVPNLAPSVVKLSKAVLLPQAPTSHTNRTPDSNIDPNGTPTAAYWESVHRVRGGGIKHYKACKDAGGDRMWMSALCKGRMGLRFCAFEHGPDPSVIQVGLESKANPKRPRRTENPQSVSLSLVETSEPVEVAHEHEEQASLVVPIKRKRGRPPKVTLGATTSTRIPPATAVNPERTTVAAPAGPQVKPTTPTARPAASTQGQHVQSGVLRRRGRPATRNLPSDVATYTSDTLVEGPTPTLPASQALPLTTPAVGRHEQAGTPKSKSTIKIARPRPKADPFKTKIPSPGSAVNAIRTLKRPDAFDVVIPVKRSRSRTAEIVVDETETDIRNDQFILSPDISPQRLDFGSRRTPSEASSLPPSSPPPDLPEIVATRPIRPLPSTHRLASPPGRSRPDRIDMSSDLSFATPPLRSSIRGSSMSVTPRPEKRTRFSLPRFISSNSLFDREEELQILLPRSETSDESESEHEEEDPESSDDELLLVGPESSSHRSSSISNGRDPSSSIQSTPASRPLWNSSTGRLPSHLVRQYASPMSRPIPSSSSNRSGQMLPPLVPRQQLTKTPRSEPRPSAQRFRSRGGIIHNRARSRSVTEERVIKSVPCGSIIIKTVAAR